MVSAYCFTNLLLLSVISWVGGGGRWAIVEEIRAGSLVFKSTTLVTPPTSSSSTLLFKIFEISIGMYSYPFSTFTALRSHCLVLGLYFRVTISPPDAVFAWGRFIWKFQSMAVNCLLALYALYLN